MPVAARLIAFAALIGVAGAWSSSAGASTRGESPIAGLTNASQVAQQAVASASSASSSASSSSTNTTSVSQSSVQDGSSSAPASHVEQSTHVAQSGNAVATNGGSAQATNEFSIDLTSEPTPGAQSYGVNVDQSADAQSNGSDVAARNDASISESNEIADEPDVCNADGAASSCSQANEVSVVQSASANEDMPYAANVADVNAVNQIGGGDVGASSGGGGNSAGVCNSGGPAMNCTQLNSVEIVQSGGGNVAHVDAVNQISGRDSNGGVGTSGDNFAGVCNAGGPATNCAQENRIEVVQSNGSQADVSATNQIAGRDAQAGGNESADSFAGVCNAGGPTTNCTQQNRVEVVQDASEADVEALNEIAGRDANAGSSQGDNVAENSFSGLCNSGGPTTNCTQVNDVTLVQNNDSEANVEAVNQITGRDGYAGSAQGVNESANSFAGVCNSGGETTNCTQRNTVDVTQDASEADVEVVNQIAGRDAAAGDTVGGNASDDSFSGVCNSGGPTHNCVQENSVELTQEGGAEATLAGTNQIAGRDGYEGSAQGGNESANSFAGVCNSGGPTTNCTQHNTIDVAQQGQNAADVDAANQITGRDAYQGSSVGANVSGNTSVDLCNTDGEATRCAQDNAVGIAQLGDGNDAQVEALNQIAGRDAYEGQARGGNVSGDSNADIETGDTEGEGQVPGGWPTGPPEPGEPQTPGGWPTGPPEPPPDDGGVEQSGGVCNGNRPAIDCTQSNEVGVAQGSGDEAQVVAANQIAGRDAYEGTARGDTGTGDSFADVCSGGAATGCAQVHAVTAVVGRSRVIDQIAGRFARGGSALVLRPHRE